MRLGHFEETEKNQENEQLEDSDEIDEENEDIEDEENREDEENPENEDSSEDDDSGEDDDNPEDDEDNNEAETLENSERGRVQEGDSSDERQSVMDRIKDRFSSLFDKIGKKSEIDEDTQETQEQKKEEPEKQEQSKPSSWELTPEQKKAIEEKTNRLIEETKRREAAGVLDHGEDGERTRYSDWMYSQYMNRSDRYMGDDEK